MNRLSRILFLAISLLAFTSCEDVIELELKTTEPQLVIEGTLNATTQLATVIISQSNDFYDNTTVNTLSGATVVLQSETGTTYNLVEFQEGTYTAENVETTTSELFTIIVDIEGKTFEANARVPILTQLNEIEVLEGISNPFGGNGEGSVRLLAKWDDPANVQNYYRIRAYVDEAFQAGIYTVLSDDFTGDGTEQNIPIREQFEENTTVTLELLSTDENYFDYFFQLSSITGEGFNATTPYNPQGNFTNDALGYFGIYFSSSLSIEL